MLSPSPCLRINSAKHLLFCANNSRFFGRRPQNDNAIDANQHAAVRSCGLRRFIERWSIRFPLMS